MEQGKIKLSEIVNPNIFTIGERLKGKNLKTKKEQLIWIEKEFKKLGI